MTSATSNTETDQALSDPVALKVRRARAPRGPVILATDGRDSSSAAFNAARLVSGKLGVAIEVVTVYEPLQTYLPGADLPPLPPTIDEECREALKSTVSRRAVTELADARWRLALLTGERTRTIAQAARDRKATIIVTGAGRHDLGARVLGGELALRTVRRADCPVLAVSPMFTGLPTFVVVATDFSPASVRAAEAALAMTHAGGTLLLLHVMPNVDTADGEMKRWSRQLEEAVAMRLVQLRKYLEKLATAGVTIDVRIRRGRVVDEILRCADAMRAELVAVGTHGAGFVERMFVGSVATDVLRHATCTVLAAPNARPAEAVRTQLSLMREVELRTPSDWAQALDEFSQRNGGRRASLEVDDPGVGAQVQQSGYAFLGATYDHRDRRVEIMLGDVAKRTRHLTHTVSDATSIGMAVGADGRDLVLSAAHRDGQALLWLDD